MNEAMAVWRGGVRRLWLTLCLMMCLGGCVTPHGPAQSPLGECAVLWNSLDQVLDRADIRDAYGVRVTGVDYLHSDRFLFALGPYAESPRMQKVLLEKMRMLALHQRYKDMAFLADEDWAELLRLGYVADEGVLKRQLAQCSVHLMKEGQQGPDYFNGVMAQVDLDQDYATINRVLGLYPLARLMTGHGGMPDGQDLLLPVGAETAEGGVRLEPALGRKLSVRRIQRMLRNSRMKPFFDFNLSEGNRGELMRYFAPSFDLGGASFGRLVPREDGGWQVDQQDPVVYFYLSQTIIQDIPALQLNYVLWFNATGAPAPWYRRGHLGGLTVRLTLDWQGRPLVYDVINTGGRFYFGLYNSDLAEIKESGDDFMPHLAGSFSGVNPSAHFNVLVEGGSNRTTAVCFRPLVGESSQYKLLDYALLEQRSEGVPRPFFNPFGVVEGSGSFEDYLLFSMGISHVSAMRQRGHQPISLVGRVYFDDPQLFTSILKMKEPLPGKKELLKKGRKRGSSLKQRVESGKAMGRSGRSPMDQYNRLRDLEM